MTELFNVTHDANNLNEYDSTVTDGGDLSTGTPGLASTTARMEAFIDDTTDIYGQIGATKTTQARWRFYVDINTLSIPANDELAMCSFLQDTTESPILAVMLNYTVADGYRFFITGDDDNGAWNIFDITGTVTDNAHYIEVHEVRATNAGSNDGTVQWWVDGVDQGTQTGLDIYNILNDYDWLLRLGAMSIPDTTSGTLYLDEFKANNDGGQIGAHTPAGQPTNLRGINIPHMRQWQPRI